MIEELLQNTNIFYGHYTFELFHLRKLFPHVKITMLLFNYIMSHIYANTLTIEKRNNLIISFSFFSIYLVNG